MARSIVGVALAADAPRALASAVLTLLAMAPGPGAAFGLKLVVQGVATNDLGELWRGAALSAAAVGCGLLAASTALAVRLQVREKTTHELALRMARAAATAPGLEHLERPHYNNEVELARAQRAVMAGVLDSLTISAAVAVQLAVTVVVLARVETTLVVLPVFAVPGLLLSGRIAALTRDAADRDAEPSRLRAHLFSVASAVTAASEARVFGMERDLVERRERLWTDAERDRRRVEAKIAGLRLVASLAMVAGYAIAVVLLVSGATRGDISLADVMLGLLLAAQIRAQVTNLQLSAGQLLQTLVAGRRYVWLIGHTAEARRAMAAIPATPVPASVAAGIVLDGVRFTYPGTDQPVLRGVDATLPAGSTVAIVGDNGAGKTTLVKLLLRAYDPDAGSVRVEGHDLTTFDVDEWRTRLAGAFQDYARFELVARESVGTGDLPRIADEAAIRVALDRAGASDVLTDLPHGLDTQLGRSFDAGVELSGGQWQKIALGRAMMRDRPLVLLLDEPSASLDPEAEDRLHRKYADATGAAARAGGITILVSHRFSTVRMADQILVLEGGRVTEAGSHDELMRLGGQYAELFTLQARPYIDAMAASTASAVAAIEGAVEEATRLRQPALGQEHLLLAVAAQPDSLGARALAALTGTDSDASRSTLLGLLRPGPAPLSSPPQATPRTVLALEQAEAEAAERRRPTTTGDLLIGILRAGEGVGFQILTTAGVDLDRMRAVITTLADGAPELADTSTDAVTTALSRATATASS